MVVETGDETQPGEGQRVLDVTLPMGIPLHINLDDDTSGVNANQEFVRVGPGWVLRTIEEPHGVIKYYPDGVAATREVERVMDSFGFNRFIFIRITEGPEDEPGFIDRKDYRGDLSPVVTEAASGRAPSYQLASVRPIPAGIGQEQEQSSQATRPCTDMCRRTLTTILSLVEMAVETEDMPLGHPRVILRGHLFDRLEKALRELGVTWNDVNSLAELGALLD